MPSTKALSPQQICFSFAALVCGIVAAAVGYLNSNPALKILGLVMGVVGPVSAFMVTVFAPPSRKDPISDPETQSATPTHTVRHPYPSPRQWLMPAEITRRCAQPELSSNGSMRDETQPPQLQVYEHSNISTSRSGECFVMIEESDNRSDSYDPLGVVRLPSPSSQTFTGRHPIEEDGCSGYCPQTKWAHNIICISACKDAQRAYEVVDGTCMTSILIDLLEHEPRPTWKHLMRETASAFQAFSEEMKRQYQGFSPGPTAAPQAQSESDLTGVNKNGKNQSIHFDEI